MFAATDRLDWRLWNMNDLNALPPQEHELLKAALNGPLLDGDPAQVGLCLRLCSRRLLQRAGAIAHVNGWTGSPHAFVLTREGWALLKAERRAKPMRRAG
jgi:hypothetical protein